MRAKKEARETWTLQAEDHRVLVALCVWVDAPRTNPPKATRREVETLPFRVTGIATGGTTLAGRSRGSGIRANTFATDAVSSPTAGHPVLREARLRAGGAVTVLTRPAGSAHAFATVTHAVICKTNAPRCLGPRLLQMRWGGISFPFAFKHFRKTEGEK